MAGQFSANLQHVLLRYVTFTFDLYDLSINFCSGQVTYAGGVINPAIGFIPEGRMVFGKSARLIAQAETVCVTPSCFVCWLSSASSWPGPPKIDRKHRSSGGHRTVHGSRHRILAGSPTCLC